MSARDEYGFLISPKNFKYKGYQITAMELGGKTVYDLYLGHVYRDTFNTVEAAKAYVDQSKF